MCIKKLLEFSAYSTELSLLELDETKLEAVENHINTNRHVLSQLNCCYSEVYQNQPQFQFLPGHRAAVLGIKSQIIKMKESRSQKRRATKSGAPMPKRVKSVDELKEMVVDSLDKFSQKIGFPKNLISNINIVDFKEQLVEGQTIYKCGYSCVFCDKIIPMLYKNYWQTSNATGHIRTHYTPGMEFTVQEISTD